MHYPIYINACTYILVDLLSQKEVYYNLKRDIMQVQPDQPARLCELFHVGQSKARGRPDTIEFPLRGISFDVCLIDGIAEVTQNQVYYNNTDQFMEMQFRFPVPPSACLHKFTASFADRLIVGRIKEKQEASKQYKQAVKEGRHAAYGQISEQSKDIMVIRIGNVNPKTEVKIQICYLEELKLYLNTFYCYELQTKMTPRYLNKLPKQDFINSFRKSKQTAIGEFRWDFKLTAKSTRTIISYKSPSHTLKLQNRNLDGSTMNFTLQKGSLERNFSFLYTIQDFHLPTFTMGTIDASTTVMVSFIPKFCQLSVADAERAEIQGKKMQTDMDSVMGQYIFLLDRSGSMGGQKIQSAKSALILFLKSLPVNSYFNVISFGSNQQSLFNKSLKNSTASIKQAVEKIKSMKADLGGTEIQSPLLDIFKRPVIEGYPKQIFLLTDGEVSNTESVIELVKGNVKHSRVHTIGVGSDVSKNLIIGCAESGKGYHTFISNHQDPASKVIQLLQDSLSPVITKVELEFDKELVESIVPNPQTIPYILKNDIVNFYITFKGRLQKITNLMLTYQDTLNNQRYTSSLSIVPSSLNAPFIDKMGFYRVIKALQAASLAGRSVLDQIYYAKAVKTKQKIIELSIKHQVLSKYTAFICQDMQLVDGRLQEIAQKGKIAVNIQEYTQQQLQADEPYYRVPQRSMRVSAHRGRGASYVMERAYTRLPDNLILQCTARKSADMRNRSRSRSRDRERTTGIIQCDHIPQRQQKSASIQYKCKSKQAHSSSSESENERSKKRANPKENQSKIEKVLAEQHAEGYWSDMSILKEFLSATQIESIPKDSRRSAAITVLVLKWLGGQNATGVYTLIIKKAVSWLKKQPAFAECAANYNYVISV